MAEVSASAEAAASWLAKADDDLAVARLVLGSSIGVNWAVCFHAQQAAEKALKALLVLLGVDFPQTHALERLHDLLPPSAASTFDSGALTGLSPWSVAGRYPEDIEDPSADTARRMVEVAQVVIDQVRAALAGK